ncbi:DUF6263 family protein [Plebeiibacterium sediminum]|uniref:DUF6263 family protein n=1 Tax=Plebeiibacterium sediminum TaxID=2992112 RepID=A0AAE3M568_9BACT|nr:DUF6263 family protein [Plebeiobacterium sediminum]MCW3787349.1 DUF6263 family protein [Plebeiobacterium sediminum]
MKKYQILTLLWVVSFACFAQKSTLQLNLKQGQEYLQKQDSKINIEQNLSGMTINIVMNIYGVMSYNVDKVNSDSYDLSVKYKSLKMNMQMPQGSMEFSSDKIDETDMFSTILGEMVGKTFYITMLKNGKIKEVRNTDVLFASIYDKLPNAPEAQVAQVKKQLQDAYGGDALKGNLEMVTSIFPDQPVKLGDTWNVSTNMNSGFSALMNSTYKYLEEGSDFYLIGGDSSIKTEDTDTYVENNGMQMKYNLSGSLVSKIKIDKSSGWIMEAKIDQELKGNTEIKGNAQMPNGMSIPMVMKNDMTITGN